MPTSKDIRGSFFISHSVDQATSPLAGRVSFFRFNQVYNLKAGIGKSLDIFGFGDFDNLAEVYKRHFVVALFIEHGGEPIMSKGGIIVYFKRLLIVTDGFSEVSLRLVNLREFRITGGAGAGTDCFCV